MASRVCHNEGRGWQMQNNDNSECENNYEFVFLYSPSVPLPRRQIHVRPFVAVQHRSVHTQARRIGSRQVHVSRQLCLSSDSSARPSLERAGSVKAGLPY